MASQDFSCGCGTAFSTREQCRNHKRNCDHGKVVEWEGALEIITSSGSECYICDRLLSPDDVLYRDETLIFCPYDGTISCSSCREAEMNDELLMTSNDIEEYLRLRRSTVPYEWLKERRDDIFRELQEYLFHPVRVQKYLDSGGDLEFYLN